LRILGINNRFGIYTITQGRIPINTNKKGNAPIGMSPLYFTLLQSLAVVMGLIVLGLIMKRRSVISANHNSLFGRLVTDLALPALIFTSLARERLVLDELLSAAIMATTLAHAEGIKIYQLQIIES